jgi:hypothetical protein
VRDVKTLEVKREPKLLCTDDPVSDTSINARTPNPIKTNVVELPKTPTEEPFLLPAFWHLARGHIHILGLPRTVHLVKAHGRRSKRKKEKREKQGDKGNNFTQHCQRQMPSFALYVVFFSSPWTGVGNWIIGAQQLGFPFYFQRFDISHGDTYTSWAKPNQDQCGRASKDSDRRMYVLYMQ